MKESRATFHIAVIGALSWMLVVLLSAGNARADEDATVDMARERFKEGVGYFDKKQYDKARAAFLQAYALKKHPAVLLNLAQSELRSGFEVDAAKHFARYLREATDASPAEQQAAEAGLLATKTVVVELQIEVDRPGAEVYVDGNLEGTTPLTEPVFVASGTHHVEARKAGKTVFVPVNAAGKSSRVVLAFEPSPVATSTEVTASHSSTNRQPFFRWLTHSPVGLVGLTLTGLGVGGGIGLTLGAKNAQDNANKVHDTVFTVTRRDFPTTPGDPCDPDPASWAARTGTTLNSTQLDNYVVACNRYHDDVKLHDNQRTASLVSFGVAAVAAVGTVIIYLADGKADTQTGSSGGQGLHAAIVPVFSPTDRGLALVGSF
jgi:PEGA domain